MPAAAGSTSRTRIVGPLPGGSATCSPCARSTPRRANP